MGPAARARARAYIAFSGKNEMCVWCENDEIRRTGTSHFYLCIGNCKARNEWEKKKKKTRAHRSI